MVLEHFQRKWSRTANSITTSSLIKQDAPQVIGIHCVAHNLELAFSDTLKSNETTMSIKELLNGCWKHYKYSPKALRELREVAEAMEIKVESQLKPVERSPFAVCFSCSASK